MTYWNPDPSRKWRLTVAAVIAVIAGPIAAETVKIRTAEHEGFTRIVVDFDDRPSWRLGRLPVGYGFRSADSSIEYDTSGIYRRIARDRLSELIPDGDGGFDLIVGCDCGLSTIEVANGWLVIDISQVPPSDSNPHEVSLEEEPSINSIAFSPVMMEKEVQLIPGLLTDALNPYAPGAERRRRSAATREYLQARIAPGRTGREDLSDDGSEGSPATPLDRLAGIANISVVDPIAGHERNTTDEGGSSCIAPDRIDVTTWGDQASLDQGLGQARTALVDAGGQPDANAFATLARRYIYLSFGAEATTVLRGAPEDTPDRTLLISLAGLVDGLAPAESEVFADQVACPGPVGLWAALAVPPLDWKGMDGRAVAMAFSALPPHLRHHLGPMLIGRFVMAKDDETARLIRNAIRRDPESVHLAPALEVARLDEKDGDVVRAAAAMADVAISNSPDADSALVSLVSGRIDRGQLIGDDLLEQLEERGYAARGTARAGLLAATRIRALRNNGLTGDAIRILESDIEIEQMSDGQVRELQTALYSDIAALSDDAEFLTLIMPRLDIVSEQAFSRVAIGARLAALGLPDQAREALGTDAPVPGPDERKVRAEIAILENRLEVAKSYLVGLDDSSAQELSARISRVEALGRVAVPEDPDDVTQDLAEVGILGAGRELLGDAQDTRRRLVDLLGE